jgi:hypothetical protein
MEQCVALAVSRDQPIAAMIMNDPLAALLNGLIGGCRFHNFAERRLDF